MAIRYEPKKILRRFKKAQVKRISGKDFRLNKAALNVVSKSWDLPKGKLEEVALKVIKGYKKKYIENISEGLSKSEAVKESVNGGKLLLQRVQNAAVYEMAREIETKYAGEFYEWLPSDAEEPDPEHQLNYGKVFQIGVGEMPGDRYGCKCGMNILVNDTKLNL